jgi:glutaredoxin-like protein
VSVPLLSATDQDHLRREFAALQRPVTLLFFAQALDEGDACLQTRQILGELTPLSDRIRVEEVNFVLEPERAARYGVDRVPAIVPVTTGDDGQARDSRIRFLGIPAGYEFASLVRAVSLVGGAPSQLSEASVAHLARVDRPMTVQVFSTPTCPHCPRAITLAHEMAWANPNITAYAVEVTEYPDLAQRYHVTGVPKTVVDDRYEILGALPEPAFVEQALADFLPPEASTS